MGIMSLWEKIAVLGKLKGRGVHILILYELNRLEIPAAVRPWSANGPNRHTKGEEEGEGRAREGRGYLAVWTEQCCDRTACRCERIEYITGCGWLHWKCCCEKLWTEASDDSLRFPSQHYEKGTCVRS